MTIVKSTQSYILNQVNCKQIDRENNWAEISFLQAKIWWQFRVCKPWDKLINTIEIMNYLANPWKWSKSPQSLYIIMFTGLSPRFSLEALLALLPWLLKWTFSSLPWWEWRHPFCLMSVFLWCVGVCWWVCVWWELSPHKKPQQKQKKINMSPMITHKKPFFIFFL